MKVGFIGLGNVGAKLAGSLQRNGVDLMVYDLNTDFVKPFTDKGCTSAKPAEMMRLCDLVITCLPSPAASTAVVTEMIPEMKEGKTWVEMSTTDEEELKRLADLIAQTGGTVAECPVSGGCHRAATGNISIFAGCDRPTFDRILPLLTFLGRKVLHTGLKRYTLSTHYTHYTHYTH